MTSPDKNEVPGYNNHVRPAGEPYYGRVEGETELATRLEFDHLEFREGLAEDLHVVDGWADLVISNGVLNLVPDKVEAYREVFRVLRPGGRIQIGDVCVEREVPEAAKRDIDLWTG